MYDIIAPIYIGATVLAAPIDGETLHPVSFQISRIFLNACITNILVLTGQQHQYIGAIQGESKC
jgi:hypothetical protein